MVPYPVSDSVRSPRDDYDSAEFSKPGADGEIGNIHD